MGCRLMHPLKNSKENLRFQASKVNVLLSGFLMHWLLPGRLPSDESLKPDPGKLPHQSGALYTYIRTTLARLAQASCLVVFFSLSFLQFNPFSVDPFPGFATI